MAKSKKAQDRNPHKIENVHPQGPEEEGGTFKETANEPHPSATDPIHPPVGDETDPQRAANGTKSADHSSDSKERTSPDSIERQDGDHDEGHGEEYYYNGSAHQDDQPGEESAKKSADAPKDSSPSPKNGSTRGGGGNNGDDDGDGEIEDGNPEKKMPFLDHLEELRWTLMRSLIAVVIGSIICFIFNEKIIQALRWVAPPDMNLVILAPTEGFMISVKVALFAGLVLALPFVAYEFWRFIVPGLLSKEKKLVPPIVFFTVLCFILGAAFSYFLILRYALKFLLNFQEQTENMIAIGKYLGFVVTLILVFGIVFELPVMSFFLSRIGLLTPDFLRTKRRYGIVIIFIVAALLTPPDVMTQLMLAVPLIVLYEISIWVSAMAVKKKEQKEAEDLAG